MFGFWESLWMETVTMKRTWGLFLDEKMDATIDEERGGEDLELDAQELANTPVGSPSHSCG